MSPEPIQQQPEPDEVEQMDDVKALRQEAAGRRRALREATAQRDQMEVQRNAAERRLVQHLAADRLVDPSDWTDTVDLEQLRGEDGAINDERIDAALADVLAAKPHWEKKADPPPPAHTSQAQHQGARPDSGDTRPRLGDALRQSMRR